MSAVDYTNSHSPFSADADTTQKTNGKSRLCRRRSYRPPPLGTFPPVLRRFVEAIADVKDVDAALVALPALAVASASIGNARRLRLRHDYHVPSTLWPVTVADSGDGKSPGMDAAMRPIVAAQAQMAEEHRRAVAEYREAVRAWRATPKADRGEEPPPPEAMRHAYMSDVTAEAVAVRLAETPRGLLCAPDEFAGLVNSFNAYKSRGGDREAWLAFYDARQAKIDRKVATPPTIFIPRAFVAVTGTIQPGILRTALTPDMIGCGFAARLLPAMPPSRERAWRDDDVPADVTDAYGRLIEGLRMLDFPEEPVLVRPSEAAMDLWRDWWRESERERAEAAETAIRAMLPKVREAGARLALVFHCCAVVTGEQGVTADVLDARTMASGIDLARWFAAEGRRVYAMLGRDAQADASERLVDWIERRGGSTTVREVCRHLRDYRKTEDAEQALRELVLEGVGHWEDGRPGPAGGHPSRRFVLHGESPDDEWSADTTPKSQRESEVPSASADKGDAKARGAA